MKNSTLLALDVDGTLLDDRKALPPANREALQRAAAQGVVLAIASGRMTSRIEPIEALLGIDCVLIGYNGATVVGRRSEGRPRISHRPLPAAVAEVLIDFSRSEGYLLNFYLDGRLYGEGDPKYRRFRDLYSTRTGAEFDVVEDIRQFRGVDPTKLIVMADPDDRNRLYDRFRGELAGRAFVTKSEPEYLEIMAPNVDKGAALLEIAAHYGVEAADTVAVGDSDNDLELLRAAGLGVAMANAAGHVRSAADVVTRRTNNEAGVAEAVERWVLHDSGE